MANALTRPDRPIVLVGAMGAGKTTAGRRLAERLGLPFADSDEAVEREAGLSVREIFERFGEAGFRACERQAMRRLVGAGPGVIAAGGGAFVDSETRALILEQCLAIWLDADVATLAERASREPGRPLLAGKDPLPVLRELAEQRGRAYAEAHLRVASDCEADVTVERILCGLSRQ